MADLKSIFTIVGKSDGSIKSVFGSARSEFSATEKKLGDTLRALDKFSASKSSLGKLEADAAATTARIGELQAKLSQTPAGKGYDKLSKDLTNAQSSLARTTDAIGKQKSSIAEQSTRLKGMGVDSKNAASETARLKKEIEDLGSKKKRVSDLGDAFAQTKATVFQLGKTVAVAGAAIGAVVGGVFALSMHTATLGDNVAKTSRNLGMQAESLQALRYAGERAGMGADGMDQALKKLQTNVAKAAVEGGPLEDVLHRIGLSAQDLQAMTPDQKMRALADAMRNVQSPGEQARMAVQIFGDEGVRMVEVLKDGSAGLDKMAADAKKVGYVMSGEDLKASEDFMGALLDLKTTVGALGRSIGAVFMPVFTTLMQGAREAGASIIPAMRAAAERIAPVIGVLGTVIGTTVSWLAKGASLLLGIPGIVEVGAIAIGLFTAALITMQSVAAWGAITKLGSALGMVGLQANIGKAAMFSFNAVLAVGKGIMWLFNAAIWANPIGLLVAGIVSIGVAIWGIVKYWEPIKTFFLGLWDSIKSGVSYTWDLLKTVFAWSPMGLLQKGFGIAFEWIGSKFDWVRDKFGWLGKLIGVDLGTAGASGADAGASANAAPALDIPPPSGSNVSTTKTSNVSFSIVQQPGESGEDLARRIEDLRQQHEREAVSRDLTDAYVYA